MRHGLGQVTRMLLSERIPRVGIALATLFMVLVHVLAVSFAEAQAAEHRLDRDWMEIHRLLAIKCAHCHGPNTEEVNLSTYAALLAGKNYDGDPLVVPFHPENSPLLELVQWNAEAQVDCDLPASPQMPDDPKEWLTKGQLALLEQWIANGALEFELPDTCGNRPVTEMDFPSAKQCKVCHPRQYDQWSRSMHHYAMHSPVFEAFNQTLLERTSGTMGTFCSRCHTPIGTALGEDGLRRNVHRARISMEGVTCIVCHRQAQPTYKSNARISIEPGTLLEGCVYGPFTDPFLPESPQVHPATEVSYLKKSSFCGACHDVTSPAGVRLEEAYSEWQNSPAAQQGQTCQSCHMGPVQGMPCPDASRPLGRAAEVPGLAPELLPLRHLSDHTFAGPDYSLLPDTEFPHKLDWMYEKDYRVHELLTPHQQKTLRDLRISNRKHLRIADDKRYELLRNAACLLVSAPGQANCSDKLAVRVDVRSKFGGHSFPTGFTAERQVWVEVKLTGPDGCVVFHSGDLDPNGDLRDGHSHYVESGKISTDRHLLNFQNKFTALTQRGTDRSVVLSVNRHFQPVNILRPAAGIPASFGRPEGFRVAKASLPPLATMGRNYPIRLPDCPGPYLLEVRLNFRHLPPTLLDAIGTPHLKHLLEIVVIDEYRGVVTVGEAR
ncbi:MAG: hypothetical protein KDA42_06295 [Planctomycetales bacterium]|nr:hypothetical protein [Planctomycetales bacterium]